MANTFTETRDKSELLAEVKKYKKKSQFYFTWKRLCRNKGAVVGMCILAFFILLICFADVLYDYDTYVIKQNYNQLMQAPSSAHPFGTDEFGRDLMARIVHGARPSLLMGLSSCAFAVVVGGLLGAVAGFYSEALGNVIMRLMDVLMSIPNMLFALTIVAAFGSSIPTLILACSISSIPRFARIMRSSVMQVRNAEYIEAARAIGLKNSTILVRHVIPNSISTLFVQATISVGSIILLISAMSFLGLGVQAPTPEWGAMLSSARTYIRNSSYYCFFPGLAIMLNILALNLLGDGLRDALDPRLK